MNSLFSIVHEDAEILVINKPAGLVCHPTKGDEYSSLISRIRLYLPQDAIAHLVNRLDRETSGLVMVAKTDETARELRRVWEKREVQKEYLAIVHGRPKPDQGTIDAPLGKDEDSIVAVKNCVRNDGAEARTRYEVKQSFERHEGLFSLLDVRPETGRKHQIRIHLSHIGCPIVGDKLYGGDENLYLDFVKDRLTGTQKKELILPNQALHAAKLSFPWREGRLVFKTEPEPLFEKFVGVDEMPAPDWPPRPA